MYVYLKLSLGVITPPSNSLPHSQATVPPWLNPWLKLTVANLQISTFCLRLVQSGVTGMAYPPCETIS